MTNDYKKRDRETPDDSPMDLQKGAAPPASHSQHDAPVTEPAQATLEDPEWIVVVGVNDRRMLTTAQVLAGLGSRELTHTMLVWRRGMPAWSPLASVAELGAAAPNRARRSHAI